MSNIGISLGILLGTTYLSRLWSPSELFIKGEQGVLYDPSDITTMWQDHQGVAPVTTPGQTVGLILDKRIGTRTEIFNDASMTFTGTPGYSERVSPGVYRFARTSIGNGHINFTGLTTGRAYLVSLRIDPYDGAIPDITGLRADITNSAGVAVRGFVTTPGTYTFYHVATGSFFRIGAGGTPTGAKVSNVSILEVPGNHAIQATAASRPVYGVIPETGERRNLLTRTEEFENGTAWPLTRVTVTANAATAPDGTLTADKLVETAITNVKHIRQTLTIIPATNYTASVYLKAAGRNFARLLVGDTTGTNGARVDVNLSTGEISSGTLGTGWTLLNATATAVGEGWYRVTVSGTSGSITTGTQMIFPMITPGVNNYLGDGTSGLFLWGAQLETGSTATNYQRVTTAFQVTEAGLASRYYLLFDGVDDGMVTGNIVPGTNKAQVFAGVRKLSDAGSSPVIVETSVSSGLNDGSLLLTSNSGSGSPADYGAFTRGTAGVTLDTPNTFAAPITNVVTLLSDIAAPSAALRVNGLVSVSSTATQGTGNYLTYPLYIGRRGGTSLPFSGHIYGLVVRFGTNLESTAIRQTEIWLGRRVAPTVNVPQFGPNLIVNGDFASGANWTPTGGWSISEGAARQASVGFNNIVYQTLPLTAGATYEVTFTVSSISSGGIFARVSGATIVSSATFTAPGTYTVYIVAPESPTQLDIGAAASTVAVVDDVSLRVML